MYGKALSGRSCCLTQFNLAIKNAEVRSFIQENLRK